MPRDRHTHLAKSAHQYSWLVQLVSYPTPLRLFVEQSPLPTLSLARATMDSLVTEAAWAGVPMAEASPVPRTALANRAAAAVSVRGRGAAGNRRGLDVVTMGSPSIDGDRTVGGAARSPVPPGGR